MGDSRAYLIRREGEPAIRRVTKDHSLVERLVDCGSLTEEEARSYPGRNFITRALGPDPEAVSDSYLVELERGDCLLLCTDGLVNTATDEEMTREVLRSGEENGWADVVDGHDVGVAEHGDGLGLVVEPAAELRVLAQVLLQHLDGHHPVEPVAFRDGTVKVTDFGIAFLSNGSNPSNEAIGSVHYISPEQAKGDAFIQICSRASGISGSISRGLRGTALKCWMATLTGSEPSKGRRLVSISEYGGDQNETESLYAASH